MATFMMEKLLWDTHANPNYWGHYLVTDMLLIHLCLGLNCEIDVSICNATENKCSNGGQCVDGLGASFTCTCPSGWSGIKTLN